MRDVQGAGRARLDVLADLAGDSLAAAVYRSGKAGYALLRINARLVTPGSYSRVVAWARRRLAQGADISWLLADELSRLRFGGEDGAGQEDAGEEPR